MNEFLIKPTKKKFQRVLAEVVSFANGQAKKRLVTGAYIADQVFASREGVIRRDGGGIPNSYGYVTGTSRLGVAWIIYKGYRVIRVVGDRVNIGGRHVVGAFGPYTGNLTAEQLMPEDIKEQIDALIIARRQASYNQETGFFQHSG